MRRILFRSALLFAGLIAAPSFALAQFGGARAGTDSGYDSISGPPSLDPKVVEAFITIDGRAEIRVQPTEIRIVLAVTSEGQTAGECHRLIEDRIRKLNAAWAGIGIPAKDIVEDFIAILPIYEWELEKRGNGDVGVEKKAGFRMQTNLHVAVPNNQNAAQAFKLALEQGVTDIIAFDYWSKELDDAKIKARELAVKAARTKADSLLTALFEVAPPAINVQEETTVRYPESLYESFTNAHSEEVSSSWRNETPYIRAYRPRNTYYRGLYSNGDVQARELPMRPEISVVSDVRIYFESPAAKSRKLEEKK